MTDISRRQFVKSVGAAALLSTAAPDTSATSLTASRPSATAPMSGHDGMAMHTEGLRYGFFKPDELSFIDAAVARLIPSEGTGPGAREAGVTNYLDKTLGGAWGSGERLYRSGPWQTGLPTQGYQLPFTPAEFFRTSLRAIHRSFETQGRAFEALPPAEQDAYLKSMETSDQDLDGIPAKEFFALLWKMTIEGYFSDPVYGGNKDMLAWKMIGFPGAYANYYDAIDRHGVRFVREPLSIASDGQGRIHPNPNIPATL